MSDSVSICVDDSRWEAGAPYPVKCVQSLRSRDFKIGPSGSYFLGGPISQGPPGVYGRVILSSCGTCH
jgi:hypothetical protein